MRALCACVAVGVLVVGGRAQQPAPAAADEAVAVPSDFVRFVAVDDGGHLDTAITTYRNGDVELVLFGAVHIADQACYDTLNDRFTQCDALLYELVGPEDYRPSKDRERGGFNPIAILQAGLKNALELQFQLDAVDYSPANFVHADMTPAEFERSMAERGESLLSIMLDMMLSGMKMQREQAENGDAAKAMPDLVTAFQNREGRHTLRLAFAQQLENMELLAAGGREGNTLLQGRNEKCLAVLQREMAAGKKRIGIYYGAAHLPHMEQRLVRDLGFTKTGHEWLVAWDCRKRLDRQYDRALVQQRRQCREDLARLAVAAKARRLAGDPLPTDGPLAGQPQQDPWGRAYVVRARPTGTRWEVASLGPDGVAGTDDDLVEQEPRGR
ncbi:MAG: type II secretion system protein GspG [Planctomycetes bacterium]|nr:type II secretion system protein GspG [Planctomycetota bacterium]